MPSSMVFTIEISHMPVDLYEIGSKEFYFAALGAVHGQNIEGRRQEAVDHRRGIEGLSVAEDERSAAHRAAGSFGLGGGNELLALAAFSDKLINIVFYLGSVGDKAKAHRFAAYFDLVETGEVFIAGFAAGEAVTCDLYGITLEEGG